MAHQTKVPNKQIINLKFLSDLIELSLHNIVLFEKVQVGLGCLLVFFPLFIIPLCTSFLLIWKYLY